MGHEHSKFPTPLDENEANVQKLMQSIQGNILKSHGRNHSRFVCLQFDSAHSSAARQWLADFSRDHVTTAAKQSAHTRHLNSTGNDEHVFVNVMLSALGYRALHVHNKNQPDCPIFRKGMKDQHFLPLELGRIPGIGTMVEIPMHNPLRDPPVSEWDQPLQNDIHAIILFAAGKHFNGTDRGSQELDEHVAAFVASIPAAAGVRVIHIENGEVIRRDGRPIEHFGNFDGVSQPLFLKSDVEKYKKTQNIDDASDMAKYGDPTTSWELVLTKDPASKDEFAFGSYMVFRKLHQDVHAYRERRQELMQLLNEPDEEIDKLIVGRRKDGSPAVGPRTVPADGELPNNFDYSNDLRGKVCPFQAHIRKCNPRVDSSFLAVFRGGITLNASRRIARRAVAYGPPLPADAPADDGNARGLLFLCANADIGLQFMFMQVVWCNDPIFQKPGTGLDPIVGQSLSEGTGTQKWPTADGKKKVEFNFTRFVHMRGGEYFFMPSMQMLTSLGALHAEHDD